MHTTSLYLPGKSRLQLSVFRRLFLLLALLQIGSLHAAADTCFICGQTLRDNMYLAEDKVTRAKERLCRECAALPSRCYLCSLPVKKDFRQLPDGRYLCERDARTAVIDDSEARELFRETTGALSRLLIRFMNIPEKNLSVAMVDRVNLQNLFKFPGREYECPNVWGYHRMVTNNGAISHQIAILSGLPRDAFKAVCAHELAHAWIATNVPRGRQGTLHGDAAEGFCELCAWMLANAQNEEGQKHAILHNVYTRGQVHAFVEAEKQFGMSDVVDWMQFGEDARLDPQNPARIRAVAAQRGRVVKPRIVTAPPAAVPPAPEVLVLKGVAWNPQKPLAIINGCTFGVNEENKVRLGTNNVTVRCVRIGQRSARVRLVASGEEKELVLQKN